MRSSIFDFLKHGSATRYPVLPSVDGISIKDYISTSDTAVAYAWGNQPNAPLRSATFPFLASSTCRAKFLELDGTYSTSLDFGKYSKATLWAKCSL